MKASELRQIIREEIRKVIDEGHNEFTNYMFFQNLNTIKKMVDKMLNLDPAQVDALLSKEHGWATDHISTATDDVSEVGTWLCSELDPHQSSENFK
jgi:hypothetical protein